MSYPADSSSRHLKIPFRPCSSFPCKPLERKWKVRLGFRSLPKPQAKLEILLRLKGSSQCGFSMENNDGLWWLMVDVGDGESSWNFRNGFGRKKEEEMTFFLSYTKAKAETLKWEMLSGTEASRTLQTSSQRSQRSDNGKLSCGVADRILRRSNG